ncbi:hypothetical protein HNY73_006108 [Argiope bruennichi]|uniref:Uncharacterized protein n=1 Tax=Argiope bruennichi TaxID=94029 RepID=A0A8T0FLD6_ARGBR|nr:hypothetical protein HNY73_006108 [Argiope bruennichi]
MYRCLAKGFKGFVRRVGAPTPRLTVLSGCAWRRGRVWGGSVASPLPLRAPDSGEGRFGLKLGPACCLRLWWRGFCHSQRWRFSRDPTARGIGVLGAGVFTTSPGASGPPGPFRSPRDGVWAGEPGLVCSGRLLPMLCWGIVVLCLYVLWGSWWLCGVGVFGTCCVYF